MVSVGLQVIYSNACEKGPVLQRFLQFLWEKIEEDNAEIDAANDRLRRQADQQTSDESTPGDSHSLMSIDHHATSSPIPIGGARTGGVQSASSPPESSSLSLLAAASKMAAELRGSLKASPTGKARRDSQTSDHLLPPTAHGPTVADPSSPLSRSSTASSTSSPSPATGGASVALSFGGPPSVVQPRQLQALSHLPTRIIFIDDRLQNCFSVYESLSAHALFDRFYNSTAPTSTATATASHRRHVPTALEVYTCHYQPIELTQHQPAPTNQTKADAAASAAATGEAGPDLELIETQIHHFLTHGEILSDPKGKEMVLQIRSAQGGQMVQAASMAAAVQIATQQLHQAQAEAAAAARERLHQTAAGASTSTSSTSSIDLPSAAGVESPSGSVSSSPVGVALVTASLPGAIMMDDCDVEATTVAIAQTTPNGEHEDVQMAVSTPRHTQQNNAHTR